MRSFIGRKSPSGLRERWLKHALTLIVPIVVVCVLLVTSLFAVSRYRNLKTELICRARLVASFYTEQIKLNPDALDRCAEFAESYRDEEGFCVQLADRSGILLVSGYGPAAGAQTAAEDTRSVLYHGVEAASLGIDPDTGERIASAAAAVLDADGSVLAVVRFVIPAAGADLHVLLVALLTAAFCAGLILVLILISHYYMGTILSPLEEITAKAKMIAGGSYGVRIQAHYDDEIGELAETINDMSAQISQNEKTQSEFISSLSHELRTPLTAITGWGETLLGDGQTDPEQTRRGVQIILREAGRLTEMVVDLLDFTRIQDGRMTLNMELTDIRAEFEDTLFMYGSRLKQEGITIEYMENDQQIPEITCDPKRMRQVFLNIFDNAAKHGGEGKRIEASICCRDDLVTVHIRDFGPGIPEDELPLVKNKFYKGSSKARGSGIGLAVCDEILQMHGGWLELNNAEGGGTEVTVALPVSQ